MPGRRECAEGGGRLEKEGPRGNNYRLGDEKKNMDRPTEESRLARYSPKETIDYTAE